MYAKLNELKMRMHITLHLYYIGEQCEFHKLDSKFGSI